MANMKLTQLSTSEFKLDSVGDFCLNSNGNCMILIGNSNEITILELMNSCDTMVLMPYSNKQITICQDKPISDIIRDIDLVKIYETGTVHESQELALDLIYTAECATEPLKARFLQADIITKNNTNFCCILTTYGYCEIYQKVVITEEWKSLDTNLSHVLLTDVFSTKVSPTHIKTYNDLKTFTNKFIITCFAMSVHSSDMIIYLGTAAGYVIALKYVEATRKFEEQYHLKTSLNRISCMVVHNNLMLVGCDQGKVRLVKINFENSCLQELDYLWDKADRMTCRKAVFTYSEDLRSYFVVFCKTAHILAYRVDLEGAVVSSSTLYVSGIKITGIENISENEFVIITITGLIKYIKILCPTKEELNIEERAIDHGFDSANYQILGVAASSSKNLWSFVLYRNKDYVHQSKFSQTSALLNVCKLSSQDSFIKLINLNLKNMNVAQDLVMAINLDIFNNIEVDRYINHLDLEKINFPAEINDAFLQKLQIKLIIVRKLATYQKMKYRKIKTQTHIQLLILEPAVQLLHILSRLRYLKQLHTKEIKLSKFQELSIICMHLQFSYLLNTLQSINISEDEEIPPQKAVDKFTLFIVGEFENYKLNTDNFPKYTEYCMMCNQPIHNFAKCEQDHEIKRCSISCTQLTLFKTKCCPHCFALARNDDDAKLQELFSTEECVRCIYCRFLLKHDGF
ncbi:uncharacterized protein LOC135954355 [Calliphora vicina]|uniref:uncharacterized protein LOC135954355 n=1 Tax=Calliphora vicina TaxID=7373 RepID=UPI00325A4A43